LNLDHKQIIRELQLFNRRVVNHPDGNDNLTDGDTETRLESAQNYAQRLKLSKPITEFILEVVEANQARKLPMITDLYEELRKYTENEIVAVVTSSDELRADQVNRLRRSLSRLILPDQKLVIQTTVDKSILGGLVVQLDQSLIDLSALYFLRGCDLGFREAIQRRS